MSTERIFFAFFAFFVAQLDVQACGPFFPVSYFPSETTPYAYRVTPHLGAELSMIGAHYYPAWTDKAPKANSISTARADELDFFAAGRTNGVDEARLKADWLRFADFGSNVCRRLEGGEKVVVPSGVPDYALEFYLYKLGHAEWLVFRRDEDPAAFGQLLALPRERRLYRTVWVHFVRMANARKYREKDRHLAALRQAIDAGYVDTAGLEAFSLRFLSHTCGERYAPLVLTAYARLPVDARPKFAQQMFLRPRASRKPAKDALAKLCTDLVGVEVAIALGAGGALPADVVRPDKPALGADRQAWIAFNQGDFALCRKLLPLAPAQSLIRLFLEARLARIDGDLDRAAKCLHEWLQVYRQKGAQAENLVTGYDVHARDDYWYTGVRAYPQSYEPEPFKPTLSRVVSGELGVVMVATRDLEEALYAFLGARNWIDVAFVAERCMTVDELIKFLRGSRLDPRDKDRLSGLLMRRLMRSGRVAEAVAWAPARLKPLCEEYQALTVAAKDAKASADDRAVAFLNLSRLTLTRGMEIMGTELQPDVAIYDGDYDYDGTMLSEPTELPARLKANGATARWTDWEPPKDRVSRRFHYRAVALEYVKQAVALSEDPDVRAWSLMFGGITALSMKDAQTADRFYKQLARMHHPRARIEGVWFNGPVYIWFREKYYNEERHAPLRVPERFTVHSLKQLSPDAK